MGHCPTFFLIRYLYIGQGSFIPTYNLFVGIGIALAMLYLQYQPLFKLKNDSEQFKIHVSLLIAVLGGFAGAFLFDAYSQGVALTFENVNKVGLTFFGGLLSGLILLIVSLRLFSLPILASLNILSLPFCIAHVFGRVGCFMAGCCFGSPTNSIFGVVFPADSLPYNHYHGLVAIHPTQLYESLFVLAVFLFLTRSKFRHPFYFYIISYSFFRFLVEYIRSDDRGAIFSQQILSPSQMISVITIIICTGLIFINKLSQKTRVLSSYNP